MGTIPKEDPSSQTFIGKMVIEINSILDTALPELRESIINMRLHGVREREANAKEEPSLLLQCVLSNKRAKDLGSDREPRTYPCSMSCNVISDLKLESFSPLEEPPNGLDLKLNSHQIHDHPLLNNFKKFHQYFWPKNTY